MRRLLILAVFVALGFVVARARRTAVAPAAPGPPEPDRDLLRPVAPNWVDAVDGQPPATHPVKAKMSSGIYHLPGMLAYTRTNPDRCYRDAASAEADGLRPAKR